MLEVLAPELLPLEETPQDPEWHPEGDVWVHTLQVIDQAAASSPTWPTIVPGPSR